MGISLRLPTLRKGQTFSSADEAPAWLKAIWRANEITEERGEEPLFDRPEFIDWEDGYGSTAEEYTDAYVLHRKDDGGISVNLIARTERGNEVLTQVAEEIGYIKRGTT